MNNDKELKDTIVSRIKQRIESEYCKHPTGLGEIAARKIYRKYLKRRRHYEEVGVIEVMRFVFEYDNNAFFRYDLWRTRR